MLNSIKKAVKKDPTIDLKDPIIDLRTRHLRNKSQLDPTIQLVYVILKESNLAFFKWL